VPTQLLNEAAVWEALLERMPLGALVRNLATLTRVGLLAPGSQAARAVSERLADADALRRARVHPVQVLSAMRTYAAGRGFRGKHSWEPVAEVVDALDAAFYLAFGAVEPSGKRMMLALDVSGSMVAPVQGLEQLSCREASAAMALVTAATEPRHLFTAFVAHEHDDRVFPRVFLRRVADLPFHLQSGARLHLRSGVAAETKVVLTARADARAFENDCLAVRTGARLARRDRADRAHVAVPNPLVSRGAALLSSSQPNSTWPRMREPAATVREPAFTSPVMTPPSCNSTRLALSILPLSSPETVTVWARTWPSSEAPVSIVRLPSTCTSPLKRPARRT